MKTCPNCHASIMDDAVFCTNCGTPLNAAPQPAPQQEAQPQQPQQPQQQLLLLLFLLSLHLIKNTMI